MPKTFWFGVAFCFVLINAVQAGTITIQLSQDSLTLQPGQSATVDVIVAVYDIAGCTLNIYSKIVPRTDMINISISPKSEEALTLNSKVSIEVSPSATPSSYTIELTGTTLCKLEYSNATGNVRAKLTVQIIEKPKPNIPPIAKITPVSPMKMGKGLQFSGSESSDKDGQIVGWVWDYGDGTNAIGVITYHAYAKPGVYKVTLKVKDDKDAWGYASIDVTILENHPPSAQITLPPSIKEGEIVVFDGSSSNDPDGDELTYVWDFGDGSKGEGMKVNHSFKTGSYTVMLTVSDGILSNKKVMTIDVEKENPPLSLDILNVVIGIIIAGIILRLYQSF